jgi:hypothetical protein
VLAERLDGVREVLDRGFRVREQYRDVREVEIDTGALPLDVQVRGSTAPTAVLCLRAQEPRSAVVFSGVGVAWEWCDGIVRIHEFDALSASTRYLVTLAVVE